MAIDLASLYLTGLVGIILYVTIAFSVIFYVYLSLALMITAKKLNVKNAWLAWIPIANTYLMSRMAQKHWWPIILIVVASATSLANSISSIPLFLMVLCYLILIIGIIFIYIWIWRILEFRGKPGWWALLLLLPGFGSIWVFIMWGILAWGKDSEKAIQNPPNIKPKVQ